MRFIKSISLFLVYPGIMFGIGIYAGIVLNDFFYPGNEYVEEALPLEEFLPEETVKQEEVLVIKTAEVLNANTKYVIEEYDMRRDTSVETIWKVPAKYLGMDREEFVLCMELYEQSPPLSELIRGFQSLEVQSFSAEKVVIRMNYHYVEPTTGFYICVENNLIVVYCDDRETMYMFTEIPLLSLPEEVRLQIILGMYATEDVLYHFLETYSS